jgi:hypothetical protein
MGYRSKVIIGVKEGKLSKQFEEILSKHDMKPSTDWLRVCVKDDMKIFIFNQIKWYYTDEWCDDIMNFLKLNDCKIDAQQINGFVFCIGLGEDGQTHSEIGDHWDYVDQECTITLIN